MFCFLDFFLLGNDTFLVFVYVCVLCTQEAMEGHGMKRMPQVWPLRPQQGTEQVAWTAMADNVLGKQARRHWGLEGRKPLAGVK